ncbi:glycosyltransferase family 2 protein [Bifidobacterium avesanii]|uniref:Glycosyltransferase n=1 Tax=Bifidobacterium avesanii TaxID=1798157 RepID=A0A7K3TK15_9BIFI|nr:glycosyltransferase family 2 protein [Bifidobacterium avesanii]KAB8290084.1 rhamnosyltransferase [Bifidobacterium avesanii]NEG78970.1 glycosyltransferase [Bifidobacterium avesanii]
MIDIFLACYNGEKYLEEQVNSIRKQTMSNWNLYISDDGSSDGSQRVIEKLSSSDQRIFSLKTGIVHKNAAYHFLDMLRYATSDYFCLSDQDDYWLPRKLEVSLSYMKGLEKQYGKDVPLLVYSDMKVVDENLSTIANSFLKDSGKDQIQPVAEEILNTSIVAGCTIMGNKALYSLICQTKYSPDIVMHDWWICDIAVSCGYLTKIPEQLVLYRQHGDNVVGAEHYSLIEKICSFHTNAAKYWENCKQVEYLYKQYNEFMHDREREKVFLYAATLKERNLAHVYKLWHCGLLKRNLLKRISQIATILFVKPNVKER